MPLLDCKARQTLREKSSVRKPLVSDEVTSLMSHQCAVLLVGIEGTDDDESIHRLDQRCTHWFPIPSARKNW